MNLSQKAKELRRTIVRTIFKGGGGHTPASLSIVEILAVLYYRVLNIDPNNPDDPKRDRFILSKGHAGVALYAVLADKGFFDKKHLGTFGKAGTILGGHPDMYKVPGVEASTGAMGHGFPFGVGVALAGKLDGSGFRVFTILGDGECQEGTIWEAAMFASQQRLDNLISIIDFNKFQALDRLDNIVGLEPLVDKWRSFGWQVVEVDGHDFVQLEKVFKATPAEGGKPTMVIAHTIKGKGLSFMEESAIWHFRMPNPEQMKIACEELDLNIKEFAR